MDWTNPINYRLWNGLTRAQEETRQAVMMDHYDQQLPRMERQPDPSAPNDSDQTLFIGRGWNLNRPIRLHPIYDQSEHQGRNRHINEWSPHLMLQSENTVVQAIAYILCGIMLPRAYELAFMPAIRNNFSHLEEFPDELRRVFAQEALAAPPPLQPDPA